MRRGTKPSKAKVESKRPAASKSGKTDPYGVRDLEKTLLGFKGYAQDNLSRIKAEYAAMGLDLSNTRYGWIRTRV